MADDKKEDKKSDSQTSKNADEQTVKVSNAGDESNHGGIMFFGIRFLIFFGLSFFILSLPYNKRPIFYYLHQTTSKVILSLTGTNYYKPTFNVQNSKEKVQENIDKAKTQFSAPLKKVFEKKAIESNSIELENSNEAQFVDEEN
jgi:hypothetical protein